MTVATENTRLLPNTPSNRPQAQNDDQADAENTGDEHPRQPVVLDQTALVFFLLQHTSNMWGTSLYSFASFIYLVEIFVDTLAPAALIGIATKLAGISLAGHVGGMIDRINRLKFVRGNIALQKSLEMASYALFLVLMGPLGSTAPLAFRWKASTRDNVLTWAILALTILISCAINLCQKGIEVSVERDWVVTIAQGDSAALNKLNASMRVISLTTRIFPSMIVSIFTYTLGYWKTGYLLVGMTGLAGVIEYTWIHLVYKRFPILQEDEDGRKRRIREAAQAQVTSVEEERLPLLSQSAATPTPYPKRSMSKFIKTELGAWREFVSIPIFWAALAMTVRELDTLKMDGIGVSFFKLAHGWEDGHISLLRGGCLITSIIGSAVGPYLQRRFGSSRTGLASLWFAALTIAPAIVMFFLPGSPWSTVIMITGIVITRGPSCTFNLVQIKQLQVSLADHPQRNRLTALQSALQDLFQLIRFGLTLIFSSADTFKWTTAVTLACHVCAVCCYTIYVARVRGQARL